MSKVLGVLHPVSDLDAMLSFYKDALDFEEIEITEWSGSGFENLFQTPKTKAKFAKLRIGKENHYLIEFSPHNATYPKSIDSNDLRFQHIAIVVSDMEKAYKKLMKWGVRSISKSYQTIPEWNKSAAGIKAFYFSSPEGHPLELIWYPPGKGNPCWQDRASLFLGIDHTAITIANTASSLKFYRNLLGMGITGKSLNYGETQENLSGVSGAKVKITSVGFGDFNGMGIEFLEYLYPLSPSIEKKMHHFSGIRTVLSVPNLGLVLDKFKRFPSLLLSDEIVGLEEISGFQKGVSVIDFDSHCILLVE